MMERLFTDFSNTNAAEWKARLEKDLKGVTFEQLSITDRNNITIHPFYTGEDLDQIPSPVFTESDWSICSHIIVKEASVANKLALSELNNGASGLLFIIEEDVDPDVLLQDIELPFIYTHFRLIQKTTDFAEKLHYYLGKQGLVLADINCCIQFDFLASYLKNGQWQENKTTDQKQWLSLTGINQNFHAIAIDASLFQNAGASSAYELACALAQINEYLTLWNDAGGITQLKKLTLTLATDTSFFEQIAKLRAFRNLVQLLCHSYNINPQLHLHIETSNIFRSPFDPYSNLLRDTVAGMAAVAGGCNSLYIHAFDEMLQEPNDFSRRMGRNQQLIFKEESYLNKVADAAAGSYYLESLTEQIAEKAWKLFQEIEQDGGLIASFENGIITATIHKQAAQLVQEYKEGKRVLIGVNKFTNPKNIPQPLPKAEVKTKGLSQLLLAEELI